MPELVTLDDIRAAAARLSGVALRTPLLPLPGASPPLLLKPELLQPTGSFKIRGAYNAICSLPEETRRRGVVAHSSGNHAAAVAWAAGLLGVPAAVVIPSNAPPRKSAAARAIRPMLTPQVIGGTSMPASMGWEPAIDSFSFLTI